MITWAMYVILLSYLFRISTHLDNSDPFSTSFTRWLQTGHRFVQILYFIDYYFTCFMV